MCYLNHFNNVDYGSRRKICLYLKKCWRDSVIVSPDFLSDARFDAQDANRRFEMLKDHSRSKAAF